MKLSISKRRKEKFESHVVRWRKDSVEFAKKLTTFSMANYWKEQRVIFSKYRLLIKKMLLLNDKTLNAYIKSVSDPRETQNMKPLHTWLYKEKIISRIPISDSLGRPIEPLLPK